MVKIMLLIAIFGFGQAKKSTILYLGNDSLFDSYNNITDLENYVYPCSNYSDEYCAKKWLEETDKISIRNYNRVFNGEFQYSTNINEVTLKLKVKLKVQLNPIAKDYLKIANKFQWKTFGSPIIHRQLEKINQVLQNDNESFVKYLSKIQNQIISIYDSGKPCFGHCLSPGESDIVNVFRVERDYRKLEGFWDAWRNVTGAKMRQLFIERMNLQNKISKEKKQMDAVSYDFFVDFEDRNFTKTIIKLYLEILPLYKELHAFVRNCLVKFYPGKFDKNGPIPAHIFGNVWAQQWTNIFPIIKKCTGNSETNNFHYEANENVAKLTIKSLFKKAEEFYLSIGMYPMTNEFWERSMFTKPKKNLVDCHGSAHDFANRHDFRIKMCTEKNLQDFTTIHHEMGHIQYYMAYRHLPLNLRGSANSGFHEAIGDTIALSVKTPEHLHKIGLIRNISQSKDFDIDYLMVTALEKVVFLPFALTMDTFLWGVYNGSVPVTDLNKYWWELKQKYQGVKPPIPRSEKDFDPGAKYHLAHGYSYIRYFFSFIVQFQFYESMCEISGYKGDLHRCDFYQSRNAGSKLLEMMKQGQSKSWKDIIMILTGKNNIESSSLLRYFEPLYKWLKIQNKNLNNKVGW